MRFSILVPVYNVEPWLGQCLDSILGQTFREFEVVAVDDGSTDGSGGILDRYAAADPRIRVIRQENRGLFDARLAALKEASGEYCVFCDSDDLMEQDALETLEKIIAEETPDMILYRAFLLRDGVREPFGPKCFPDGWITDRKEMFRILLTTFELLPMWKKAVRRELFDLTLDPERYRGLNNGEDFLYSVRLFTAAERVWNLNDELYDYRETSGMMHRFKENYYSQYRRVYREAGPVLEKEDLPDRKALLGVYLMHAAYGAFHQCAYLEKPVVESVKAVADDECFRKAFYRVRHSECWKMISRHERLALVLIRGKRFRTLRFLIRRIKKIKKI